MFSQCDALYRKINSDLLKEVQVKMCRFAKYTEIDNTVKQGYTFGGAFKSYIKWKVWVSIKIANL